MTLCTYQNFLRKKVLEVNLDFGCTVIVFTVTDSFYYESCRIMDMQQRYKHKMILKEYL